MNTPSTYMAQYAHTMRGSKPRAESVEKNKLRRLMISSMDKLESLAMSMPTTIRERDEIESQRAVATVQAEMFRHQLEVFA